MLENLSKNVLSYDSINSKLKEIENFIELTTESINTDSKLLKIDQMKLFCCFIVVVEIDSFDFVDLLD